MNVSSVFLSSVALLGATALPALSFAQAPQNPYVNLYTKRLEFVQFEVQRQESVAQNARALSVRMNALAAQGAVTRAEADAQEAAWKIAAKKVELARAKVEKADALLSIARQRIEAGLDMPVCPSND
jgi:multidrug resistance efflux pump